MNTFEKLAINRWMAFISFTASLASCHTQNNDKRGGFTNYLPSFSRATEDKSAEIVASDLGLNSSSVAGTVACDQQNGVLIIHLAKADPAGHLYRPSLGIDVKVAFSISGAFDNSKCQPVPDLHEMQCPGLKTGETLSVAATVTLPSGDSGDTPLAKCTGS